MNVLDLANVKEHHVIAITLVTFYLDPLYVAAIDGMGNSPPKQPNKEHPALSLW